MEVKRYNPTLVTARRAAEIWRRMLASPKFDNGDHSPGGGIAKIMAHMIPTNADEGRLQAFGDELVRVILAPSDAHPDYFPNNRQFVDYGPDGILQDCAAKVGLKCEFPWKTQVAAYSDHVAVTAGYAADTVYHYLLPNGKWLVTKLTGADIEKVKKFVVSGEPINFLVEDSE